jgi:hypothetical protein
MAPSCISRGSDKPSLHLIPHEGQGRAIGSCRTASLLRPAVRPHDEWGRLRVPPCLGSAENAPVCCVQGHHTMMSGRACPVPNLTSGQAAFRQPAPLHQSRTIVRHMFLHVMRALRVPPATLPHLYAAACVAFCRPCLRSMCTTSGELVCLNSISHSRNTWCAQLCINFGAMPVKCVL